MNDTMPAETATTMLLTEPRLNNTMRKRCACARCKVHTGTRPLVVTGRDAKGKALGYQERPADPAPLVPKDTFAGRTMAQLVKWLRRCKQRRLGAQRLWEKWQGRMFPNKQKRLLALEVKAAHYEDMADSIEREIKLRTQDTEYNGN